MATDTRGEVNEVMVSQADENVSRPDSLRQFADWLEMLEATEPDIAKEVYMSFSCWVYEPEKIRRMARALAPCNKRYGESWMELSRWFGQIRFEANINRDQVCTKRVVGTRTRIEPARPERVIEEEIVEWDCAPILDDNDGQA